MRARLFCKTGQMTGSSYEFTEEASIGKNLGNTIHLQPNIISGQHARIYFDRKAGCFVLEDLKSRNGTKLDGMRVRGKEKLGKLNIITFANMFDFIFQPLAEGVTLSSTKGKVDTPTSHKTSAQTMLDDEVVIPTSFGKKSPPEEKPSSADGAPKTVMGDDVFPIPKFWGSPPAKPPVAPPKEEQRTMFDDGSPLPPALGGKPPNTPDVTQEIAYECKIEFKNLKSGEQTFTLKEGENTIGRSSSCTIAVDDNSMSRTHALITIRGRVITIKDMGSKNGTLASNKKVTTEREITPNTALMFGLVKAKLIVNKK